MTSKASLRDVSVCNNEIFGILLEIFPPALRGLGEPGDRCRPPCQISPRMITLPQLIGRPVPAFRPVNFLTKPHRSVKLNYIVESRSMRIAQTRSWSASWPGYVVSVMVIMLSTTAICSEWVSGIVWPEPAIVDPGPIGGPPSDAIILFNGKDLSQFEGGEKWVIEDDAASPRGGEIRTKASFGDCQLHLEWASPAKVSGRGQGRGNSGVFLGGLYEIQILDSFENTTYFDGQAGALYKTKPPLVNACRKPGEWQSYDIIYNAPRFDDHGTLLQPGYITVLHNGVLIQNHTEILGETSYEHPPVLKPHGPAPIRLQYHGNPVRFRNIWVREIPEPQPKRPE